MHIYMYIHGHENEHKYEHRHVRVHLPEANNVPPNLTELQVIAYVMFSDQYFISDNGSNFDIAINGRAGNGFYVIIAIT